MDHFKFDASKFSKNTFFVAGYNVQVYNLDKIIGLKKDTDVNVLYLSHGRGGSHKDTEIASYVILEKYYKTNPSRELMCVVFDSRNHGERLVDRERNTGWPEGNSTHAMDMIGSIDGCVEDIHMIMEYLPHVIAAVYPPNPDIELTYHNIVSGISLGGHVTIRFGSKYPELVEAIIPVIGCSDLTSLMVNRLKKRGIDDVNINKKLFYCDYAELDLTEAEKKLYPESFHEYVSKRDIAIYENFRFDAIKIYALFGAADQMVPPLFTKTWLEMYQSSSRGDNDVKSFSQEGKGHEVTTEMIESIAEWITTLN